MSTNGYEIRMGLVGMAKDMLYEGWHQAVDAARHNASLTHSTVAPVPPPSFEEIEKLANQLYGFVQKNAAVRAATPSPLCKGCHRVLGDIREKAPRVAEYMENETLGGALRNPSMPDDYFGSR